MEVLLYCTAQQSVQMYCSYGGALVLYSSIISTDVLQIQRCSCIVQLNNQYRYTADTEALLYCTAQ